ncbi:MULTISPECIES: hypothetical protein [Rhodococcus]|jgi:hypothetical protein|uniref:hypothetical protein n=1 Tax=Rhodococcus TaxID=1827 RepID=UPI00068257D4|nr:hypothetical protein [Rhodococcus jostii]
MNDETILYEAPIEIMAEAAALSGECAAQSVIPFGADGRYRCACTCERWEVEAESLETGLEAARRHTGAIAPVPSANGRMGVQ